MKILLATSEMAPFAKTGGLADVAGALPKALAALGHEVAVVMPLYGSIDRAALGATLLFPEVRVDLPTGGRSLAVWTAPLPGTPAGAPVTVYLIEDDGLFNRPQLYGEDGRDYPDNALRFAYFCMAALWMIKGLVWKPDIIHCNDWQTALIPIYLANRPDMQNDPDLTAIRILFTIHNLSYQGLFPKQTLDLLGLPPLLFNSEQLEFFDNLNLLKGALVFSHHLTTVSKQYAKEIQTAEFGCGLEGVLRQRADRLTGILNGIDNVEWNPETDKNLPAKFSRADKKNKALSKAAVQKHFGLPVDPKPVLLAVISRLANQKGLDLLVDVLPGLLSDEHVQFVLLGTGQPEYHEFFTLLAERYPTRVGIELGFNNALAHQIEAGADVFLMPSRFEPCGLNQFYSLRYGTVPIVRKVGGLADSIVNIGAADSISSGKATGYVFGPYKPKPLADSINKAIALFRGDRKAWEKLMDNGMAQDFSWTRSAKEYDKLMKLMLRAEK